MPSESDLRKSLHDGTEPTGKTAPSGEIDITEVLRRSRARRRPRVLLAGAVSVLAVAAIVVPVTIASLPHSAGAGSVAAGVAPSVESASGTGAADSSYADPDPTKRAPAEKLNLCTGALADVAPAQSGLVLTVAPLTASSTATSIPATVTLTNTGTTRVTGSSGNMPSLTLSRNGITIWHSNGALDAIAVPLDLAPGASTTFSATFEPVVCGVDDDLADSFRPDLPAAGPGTYALSAAMDIQVDAAAGSAGTQTPDAGLELVTGPLAVVTLT